MDQHRLPTWHVSPHFNLVNKDNSLARTPILYIPLFLTLAPIWLPHWPACKWTISRILNEFSGAAFQTCLESFLLRLLGTYSCAQLKELGSNLTDSHLQDVCLPLINLNTLDILFLHRHWWRAVFWRENMRKSTGLFFRNHPPPKWRHPSLNGDISWQIKFLFLAGMGRPRDKLQLSGPVGFKGKWYTPG